MKLRLPIGLLSFVTAFLVTSAHAASVSNWTDFKSAWDNGTRDFTLTGNIEFPPFDVGDSLIYNTDDGIKPSSALAIEAGTTVTLEGENHYFGYPTHEHNHSKKIARSFYSAGTFTARNLTFVNNYSAATQYGKAGSFYADDGANTRFEQVTFSKNHLKVESDSARTATGGAFVNGKGTQVPTAGATAWVQGCLFEENFAQINCTSDKNLDTNVYGGAIINNYKSELTISRSTFKKNNISARTGGKTIHAYGGAIESDGKLLKISDSVFIENSVFASFGDGATLPSSQELAGGGALQIVNGETYLERVRFEGNSVTGNARSFGIAPLSLIIAPPNDRAKQVASSSPTAFLRAIIRAMLMCQRGVQFIT